MITARGIALSTATLALLCGCAGTSAPSLVDSKSEAQLLRNGVAERLPPSTVSATQRGVDVAVECGSGDPRLAWQSGVLVALNASSDVDATDVFDELISTFVAEGWVTGRPSDTGTQLVNSASGGSVTVLLKDATVAPAIKIDVVGRCVETAGLDSDEVGRLLSH